MERRGATYNADAEALERGAAAAAQLAKTAKRQRPQSAQLGRSSFSSSSSAYATPQPPHSARASSAAPRPSSAAATASRGGGSGVLAENAGANNNDTAYGCGGASPEVQLAALQAALKRNMRKVIDLFREWDENGDGQISKKEVRCCQIWERSASYTHVCPTQPLSNVEQFRQAMKALRIGAAADAGAVEGLFVLLDRDGTGTIDFRELHQLVKPPPSPFTTRVPIASVYLPALSHHSPCSFP